MEAQEMKRVCWRCTRCTPAGQYLCHSRICEKAVREDRPVVTRRVVVKPEEEGRWL